ncbi:MAG: hypothetical protein HWQ41_09390 [Nostoc sp. NOS(2021)]|uniref:hypothetical protein n=1 Tax=Nostoc sp. NOS(2021) TaxID=2815407 RepID=UPI0025D12341|nr:hypothetical protein [Nostoc sp. NOS(2021)]MBN3895461.1 hypothetical protein [Nostoc sp. NOS(2021)]
MNAAMPSSTTLSCRMEVVGVIVLDINGPEDMTLLKVNTAIANKQAGSEKIGEIVC